MPMSIYGQCQWDGDTVNNFDFVRPKTKALWTFDNDDGVDSGPYGYDLTSGHLDYALGKFGRCGYFDGNNYLRATASCAGLRLSTMSACFWMKSSYANEQYIFGNVYAPAGNTTGYNFGTTSSRRLFYESFPGDGSVSRITGGATYPVDGNWNWIVITRGSTYTRFFINGKLDYQAANGGLGFSSNEITSIGAWWYAYYGSAYDFFRGYLDQLHILDEELSHATIRRMYAFQMGWI